MKKIIQSFFLKQAIRNFVTNKKNINHKYLEFDSAHGINSENFEQMNLWLLKN